MNCRLAKPLEQGLNLRHRDQTGFTRRRFVAIHRRAFRANTASTILTPTCTILSSSLFAFHSISVTSQPSLAFFKTDAMSGYTPQNDENRVGAAASRMRLSAMGVCAASRPARSVIGRVDIIYEAVTHGRFLSEGLLRVSVRWHPVFAADPRPSPAAPSPNHPRSPRPDARSP